MTKDTLPSPVTLSTPERLRDALERYGQHEEGCNYFADPERVTLCDCGYEAALIDAIPSPVSVPEGDAREIARRLVAEAHYGVMTNEQLEDNITAALLSAESRARPQWHDIETAPRNGDTIIVFRRCQGWDVLGCAYWARAGSIEGWIAKGFHEIPGELGLAAPTHWQPLPAPPSLSSPEEG